MASSSTSSPKPKYQVFLSFRGEDTRLNFTTFLLKALKDKGFSVFIDKDEMGRGKNLSQLLTAIEESQIALVVLSEQYASSSWCLKELEEIMDRSDKGLIEVIPIFFHVEPSDVRKISRNFKASFDDHQGKTQPDGDIQKWKDGFRKVGNLVGHHIKEDRSEHSYIMEIVEDVSKMLSSKSSISSQGFVGNKDEKDKILELIHREDIRVIGICGMGGLGKTTLADAVFKEASRHFDHGCSHFLFDVREKFEKKGMESVVKDFVGSLLNQENIGIPLLDVTKARLGNKRALVVLDDVNHFDQMQNLGVQHLGEGSKIIVTSRDQQVLRNAGAERIELKPLNKDDSVQLFRKHAFEQRDHAAAAADDELLKLSVELAERASGLPLALKVFGSRVCGQPKQVWESFMTKLDEFPETEISGRLQLSFDGLEDWEKDVFLDIACFLKGYDIREATKMLDCCYKKCGGYAITKLVDRCLIEISRDFFGNSFNMRDTLWMHDSLEEMGWGIVARVA